MNISVNRIAANAIVKLKAISRMVVLSYIFYALVRRFIALKSPYAQRKKLKMPKEIVAHILLESKNLRERLQRTTIKIAPTK